MKVPNHLSFLYRTLIALVALSGGALRADTTLLSESFETGLPTNTGAVATGQTLSLASGSWYAVNHSTVIGTVTGVSDSTADGPIPAAHDGAHYALFNYNLTSGANTISAWLITPELSFTAGDVLSFYTRTVDNPTYADRLYVRASDNGGSLNIGTGPGSVGDFDMVLGTINPGLVANGYPNTYTEFVYVVPFTGSGRIAFHYHVTSGGPSGLNSDNVGIDAVSITSAIPEPSTYAAMAGVAVLGLAAYRRRRSTNAC
jgi:hypothetical protein